MANSSAGAAAIMHGVSLDSSTPATSISMDRSYDTLEEFVEAARRFNDGTPEEQAAARAKEKLSFEHDPYADELDAAHLAGDGARVQELLTERKRHRGRRRAVVDERLRHAHVKRAIHTAVRPIAPLAPRTPAARSARPAGRPARRPSGTRAGPDGDDGPAPGRPSGEARPSIRERLAAAIHAFRTGGRW